MPIYFLRRKRKNSEKKQLPAWVNRKTVILAVLLILLASLLFNLLLVKKVVRQHQTIAVQRQELVEAREPEDSASEIEGRWYGLCPKNMIHSVEDFRRIVEGDPVLATHFADFDWENARMGKLEKSLWTHVTYRKDGLIRATRKVIRLPKGDGYITDGDRWVRSYCCNDYVLAADIEQKKASIDKDLDRLRQRESTDPIPEPSTFLLVLTGLAGLGLTGFGRRRR